MTDDIVARLRQSHRVECDCFGCEAADVIERLRREVEQRDRLCIERKYQLRDAAETELLLQQEICRLIAEQTNMTSVDVAKDRGWSCFECGFCGVVNTSLDTKGTCAICNKEFYADE